MISLESASGAAVPYLVTGLVVSPLGLLISGSAELLTVTIVHLVLVVVLGLALAIRLAPLAGDGWFTDGSLGRRGRLVASGVAVVVLTTGVVGLVTLASAAALRLDPSLQFLQLLSALDIAWVVAALVVGGARGWGIRAGIVAGATVGALCVLSIWNYLRVVGFGAGGEWVVDGARIMTLVIPFDVMAAVLAGAVFWFGTRRADQPTEQLSAQSYG